MTVYTEAAKLSKIPMRAPHITRDGTGGMLALLDDGSEHSDRPFVTSMRRIGRVATVAAEVGMRYARGRVAGDPGAWLFAPRDVFSGKSALEACQGKEDFLRGMILHSLELGFDCRPEDLDELISDEPERLPPIPNLDQEPERADVSDCSAAETSPKRLFCASIVDRAGNGTRLIFHAGLASDAHSFEADLGHRMGVRLAHAATIFDGYDPSEPVAVMLVSKAVEQILRVVDHDPEDPMGIDLEVTLEQRFT